MKYKVSQIEVWYDNSGFIDKFEDFYTINTHDLNWIVDIETEEDGYNVFRALSKIRNQPLIIISPLIAKTIAECRENKKVSTRYTLTPVT